MYNSFIERSFNCTLCEKSLTPSGSLKEKKHPILLECGHTLCRQCLQEKWNMGITCKECTLITKPSFKKYARDILPINFYVLGYMNELVRLKSQNSALAVDGVNFDYIVKKKCNSKRNSSCPSCYECEIEAEWFCEECKCNYCSNCWNDIHSFAKSLRRHARISACKTEGEELLLNVCHKHRDQNLEFHCEDCSVNICSTCAIQSHQGHGLISLKEKVEDLKMIFGQVKSIQGSMKSTIEEIKELTSSSESYSNKMYLNLVNQISAKFSYLHGILQLEEDRLLKIIHRLSNDRKTHLMTLSKELADNLESVSPILWECVEVSKDPRFSGVSSLKNNFNKIKSLSCRLTVKQSNSEIKVEFNDKIVEALRKYCTLKVSPLENYALEAFQDSSSANAMDVHQISESNDAAGDNTLNPVELAPSIRSLNLNSFNEKEDYQVTVTFVKSPKQFYVTLTSNVMKKELIEKGSWAKWSSSANKPNAVFTGQVYMVDNATDKTWFRVQILEVCQKKKEPKDKLYYLDYGHTEWVARSRLRCMPVDLLAEPPLAVKCRLFSSGPANRKSASADLLKNSDKYYLEVLLDSAQPISEITAIEDDGRRMVQLASSTAEQVVEYPSQTFPPVGQRVHIIISHVNSSSDFYVHMVNDGLKEFPRQSMALQKYYNHRSEKGCITNPILGMPCVARYSVDNTWYRARIVSFSKSDHIKVFYVDYGNVETLPWGSVRSLDEPFSRYPPLAFHCTVFVSDKPESSTTGLAMNVCKYLQSNVQGRVHQMEIMEISRSTLIVNVYTECKKSQICQTRKDVNIISPEMDGQSNSVEKEEEEEEEGEITCIGSVHDSISPNCSFEESEGTHDLAEKKKIKLIDDKAEIGHFPHEEFNSIMDCDDKNCDEDNGIYRAKVEVLSVTSPSSIYITFPELANELTSLQSNLNEFYQSCSPENEMMEWSVDSKCVVLCSETNNWCRATVLEVMLEEDKVKVFLKDTAGVLVVPRTSIRRAQEIFDGTPPCAIKCHLGDVCPVNSSWPETSCEFFINELQRFKDVYITRKGEIKGSSLPIEMWVQKVVWGSALEPTDREWMSLNRLLVQRGLALPIKENFVWAYTSVPEVSDSSTCTKGDLDKIEKFLLDPSLTETKTTEQMSNDRPQAHTDKWLPPNPLQNFFFIGMPTYVDNDAIIYLHDILQDGEKLEMIKKSLLEDCNSLPASRDKQWSPGEPCIVKYHVDSCWYRGLIEKCNSNSTYDVLFVDYGNVEICEITELRENKNFREIPILTHKLCLQGIESITQNQEWPAKVIDLIHSMIVDKKCQVTLSFLSNDPLQPSIGSLIVIDDMIDVSTFLVSNGIITNGKDL